MVSFSPDRISLPFPVFSAVDRMLIVELRRHAAPVVQQRVDTRPWVLKYLNGLSLGRAGHRLGRILGVGLTIET